MCCAHSLQSDWVLTQFSLGSGSLSLLNLQIFIICRYADLCPCLAPLLQLVPLSLTSDCTFPTLLICLSVWLFFPLHHYVSQISRFHTFWLRPRTCLLEVYACLCCVLVSRMLGGQLQPQGRMREAEIQREKEEEECQESRGKATLTICMFVCFCLSSSPACLNSMNTCLICRPFSKYINSAGMPLVPGQ